MSIEEFNKKIMEIKERINFPKNVIRAEEEYISGHGVYSSHSLRQSCLLKDGTEIELVIKGGNSHSFGSWISAILRLNGRETSIELRAGDVTEDDFILLWEREPCARDSTWELQYWQRGSYKCTFRRRKSGYIVLHR